MRRAHDEIALRVHIDDHGRIAAGAAVFRCCHERAAAVAHRRQRIAQGSCLRDRLREVAGEKRVQQRTKPGHAIGWRLKTRERIRRRVGARSDPGHQRHVDLWNARWRRVLRGRGSCCEQHKRQGKERAASEGAGGRRAAARARMTPGSDVRGEIHLQLIATVGGWNTRSRFQQYHGPRIPSSCQARLGARVSGRLFGRASIVIRARSDGRKLVQTSPLSPTRISEERIVADQYQAADAQVRDMQNRPKDEVANTLDEFPDDVHTDPGEPAAAQAPAPAAAAASQWRVALSLLRLREQVNAKFPGRSKDSDGTIGDQNHCPGSSDHCPNISDGGVGVVTAMDITHDPAHGLDAGAVAETLRLGRDPRIKYIISNRRIANFQALDGQPAFAWRPYNGPNPHNKHFHLSVRSGKTGPSGYDTTTTWNI